MNPLRRDEDAALALNRLDDDRGHVGSHRRLHRVEIAVRDVRHRAHLSEALAVLGRARHRERAHRAAVERVVEGDDALALLFALHVEVVTRELEERLVRLRARVAEERAIEPRALAQLDREADVRLVVIVVRRVQHLASLLRDRGDERRVRVAHRRDGDPRREIEAPLAVDVEQLAPAPALDDER